MNQFKDVFLGTGSRDYKRAADTQKCIRVSGKHNDLEEVGYDTYHHTFFEMLGNWSFGDYYKKEAIGWSWELLTDVWKLPKERLHATVFRTDDESFEIWKKFLPESQIHRCDEKDNFWEMGETGPCGPCSEIHFDRTPDCSGGGLVNAGVPEVIEIWNNVFIQYNRSKDGTLEELSAKHVDTGMGFERICAVMQGKDSNYDTDVFSPIISEIESLSGKKYSTQLDDKDGIAMRVMADHIRTLSFSIADGAIPGNEGRSYVLRRILRRAARYSRNLGFDKPILFRLVGVLCETMGDVFPEIVQQRTMIEKIIRAEEESFLVTLDRGLELFDEIISRDKNVSGEEAFKLYDTFGFPFDLTKLLARERNVDVDSAEFTRLLSEQKERSRAARKQHVQEVTLPSTLAESVFVRETLMTTSLLIELSGNCLVLSETPFYMESGGQISDTGTLTVGGTAFNVIDVRKSGSAIVHILDAEPTVSVGDSVLAEVNAKRRWAIQRNHSATHLLHEALRQVLGSHVKQAGSVVTEDHLRFDFAHFAQVDGMTILEIEKIVNEKIRERHQIITLELPVEEARKVPNVKMFFADKYGDKVRVVIMDEKFSAEFCGGTHCDNTSDIGLLYIRHETAVASGVRRIEAVTSAGVEKEIFNLHKKFSEAKRDHEKLSDRIKHLEKQLAGMRLSSASKGVSEIVSKAQQIGELKIVAEKIQGIDGDAFRDLGDSLRSELKSKGIGLLATIVDDKVQLVCVVTDDLVDQYSAGKLVGAVAKELGGGGGGKAHLATAGGREVAKLDEALKKFVTSFER